MMNDNHRLNLVVIDMNMLDFEEDLNRVYNRLIEYIDRKMLMSFHNLYKIVNDLGEKMMMNYQENNLKKDFQ
jgi:hypothetical protein